MPYTSYKPRLSVEISEQHSDALSRIFHSKGMKTLFFQGLLDLIIPLLKAYGYPFIGAVIEKKIEVSTMLLAGYSELREKSLAAAEEGKDESL